ncbi:alpha/beta fold hydrolase [Amycolatopsis sp. GM8]|uniref:alpha/beta fold hydrolase n=1 Tax=Amycolatopsis sp. GM8 TaxID=2896530 RepID=UPI001F241FB6|nr:alpha/beta hydrolase [Amycolatopsis sp. GM8]
MLDGLEARRVERDGVGLAVWSGGSGPTVLLLHGYPENSAMWRDVVPALLTDHRVILMDLRGYGRSDAPADATYSKREMAADAAAVLRALDAGPAHVVGHDRGARVVHRLCLDQPDLVASAAVLDIVPTLHMYESVDRLMAETYFHWFFLTRGNGLPESLLRADPKTWIRSRFTGRHGPEFTFPPEVVEEYAEAFARPGVIEATCADYRAAATIDLEHDRADRDAGRRIRGRLLVGWGKRGYVGRAFDVPEVWREYAADVQPAAIDADHYVAEENPEQTVAALRTFWAAS